MAAAAAAAATTTGRASSKLMYRFPPSPLLSSAPLSPPRAAFLLLAPARPGFSSSSRARERARLAARIASRPPRSLFARRARRVRARLGVALGMEPRRSEPRIWPRRANSRPGLVRVDGSTPASSVRSERARDARRGDEETARARSSNRTDARFGPRERRRGGGDRSAPFAARGRESIDRARASFVVRRHGASLGGRR